MKARAGRRKIGAISGPNAGWLAKKVARIKRRASKRGLSRPPAPPPPYPPPASRQLLYSDSRWRFQKSSTGYPVLDFRPPAFGPEIAKATVGYPAVDFSSQPLFSDSRWRFQKSSTGYPVLDFRPPAFGPDLAPVFRLPAAVSKVKHRISGA